MNNPMLPRERCDYSAVVDRAPLKLPGGARLAFWSIVNYEVWDIGRAMPRQVLPPPTGAPLLPDVPHWSWHEYGMRVGCWRFFDLYERLGIKPTLAVNARTCEDYPRVAEEAKRLGWEFMGHCYDQMPMHKWEDQPGMINRSMGIIEKFTGKRPIGWLGPGLTETLDTPEHLVEAGVKYIGDWVFDDEPAVIRTAKGPLVALPYTVEINDITVGVVQHHESEYWAKRAIDQFDRLYQEGKDRVKIMALAIHPYISGQPHRIKYLEQIYDYVNRFEGVVHWNGEEIYDWFAGLPETKQALKSK
jgi:allantoinase